MWWVSLWHFHTYVPSYSVLVHSPPHWLLPHVMNSQYRFSSWELVCTQGEVLKIKTTLLFQNKDLILNFPLWKKTLPRLIDYSDAGVQVHTEEKKVPKPQDYLKEIRLSLEDWAIYSCHSTTLIRKGGYFFSKYIPKENLAETILKLQISQHQRCNKVVDGLNNL